MSYGSEEETEQEDGDSMKSNNNFLYKSIMGLLWSKVAASLFSLLLPGIVSGFVPLTLPRACCRSSDYIRTKRQEVVSLALFFGQGKDDGTIESHDKTSKPNLESRLLDSLFSFVDSDNKNSGTIEEDPRQELYRVLDLEIWRAPVNSSATTDDSSATATAPIISSDMQAAQTSLMNFLQLWARQLEDDNAAGKGLTTPIVAKDFQPLQTILVEAKIVDLRKRVAPRNTKQLNKNPSLSSKLSDKLPPAAITEGSNGNVERNTSTNTSQPPPKSSMKLIFRPPKRYLSYKEQRSLEKGVLPDRKGAKVDAWSPGGVELIVGIAAVDGDAGFTNTETIHDENAPPPQQQQQQLSLQLQALRCDVDGDTVIKFTSERAIVRRLEEAIRIWRKVRAMKAPSSLSISEETTV